MRVVGTMVITVGVLINSIVCSGRGNQTLPGSEAPTPFRRPVSIEHGFFYKDQDGFVLPLYGHQTFYEKDDVIVGWGNPGGPIQPICNIHGHPFVLDGTSRRSITDAEFRNYGITGWAAPPPSPQLGRSRSLEALPRSQTPRANGHSRGPARSS